jgi:hypothetical protein
LTSIAADPGPRASIRGWVPHGLLVGLALAAGGAVFGLLAGDFAASGQTVQVAGLALVFVPVAIWKRPQLGPLVVLAAAILIEQVGATAVPDGTSPNAPILVVTVPVTGKIPLFNGLGGLHLDPSDLLLIFIALVYFARTQGAKRIWPQSHVSRAVGAYFGAVVFGIVIGQMHHGSFRISMMETRPFVYLCATYMLTSALVRSRSTLRSALWVFVIATGVKALQGIYVFFAIAIKMHPRPDSVIGHEVAYIFSVYIFLVGALWLFQVPGLLRKVATWLLPLVIVANLVNDRRTAWLMLGAGLVTLAAVGYGSLPSRRRILKRTAIGLLAISCLYFPAYWNKSGTLAGPAVAVRSQFSPNARDAASDLYRDEEIANLKLNIHQGGILGKGWGVPIDYALPIVDLSKSDPNIKYVPHDGVLYVLMRMGLPGAIAMWCLLGAGCVAGCRLARSVDRELAVVGVLLVCSLVAYVLEGATDMGFAFARVQLVTGIVLGLAEAARRLARPSWSLVDVTPIES